MVFTWEICLIDKNEKIRDLQTRLGESVASVRDLTSQVRAAKEENEQLERKLSDMREQLERSQDEAQTWRQKCKTFCFHSHWI